MFCFVGCLTSLQQASVSQRRICTDNFTCCHTEIEAADQTFYLTQSQCTDTGPTSPSTDPIMPVASKGRLTDQVREERLLITSVREDLLIMSAREDLLIMSAREDLLIMSAREELMIMSAGEELMIMSARDSDARNFRRQPPQSFADRGGVAQADITPIDFQTGFRYL